MSSLQGLEISSVRGEAVIAWFERWGERLLKGSQPDVYRVLLMHVGATDTLRRYSGATAYWQYVQALLDCFFTTSERAQMCAELLDSRLFQGDPGFLPFSHQARAEIRCRELVMTIEATAGIRASLRSIG